METPIEKPIKVPSYVLQQIVRNDELVEASERAEAAQNLAERVEGSLINLNNDGKPDLLVQGDGGANITGFWVFHNVGGKWQQTFSARAFGLSIDKTYTNGYRDISISAMTAVVLFGSTLNYNLEKYVPRECWEQNMGANGKSKINYFRCSQDSEKPYR